MANSGCFNILRKTLVLVEVATLSQIDRAGYTEMIVDNRWLYDISFESGTWQRLRLKPDAVFEQEASNTPQGTQFNLRFDGEIAGSISQNNALLTEIIAEGCLMRLTDQTKIVYLAGTLDQPMRLAFGAAIGGVPGASLRLSSIGRHQLYSFGNDAPLLV